MNPFVTGVGYVEVALSINRNIARPPEVTGFSRRGGLDVDKRAKASDKCAFGIENLDAMIPGISYVNHTVWPNCDTPWFVEFTFGATLHPTPVEEKFADGV